MTVFTREELEYLMQQFMLTNADEFEHNLERKLQYLIYGYCDHQKSGVEHVEFYEINCKHEIDDYEPTYQCSKCKNYYGMHVFERCDDD